MEPFNPTTDYLIPCEYRGKLYQAIASLKDKSRLDALLRGRTPILLGNGRYPAVSERSTGRRLVMLHRFVANAQPGDIVDHINRQELDLRSSNLRCLKTKAHSNMNTRSRRIKNRTSSFKGVSYVPDTGMWRAKTMKDGINYELGHYASEIEAALAYNDKVSQLWPEGVPYLNEVAA